MPRDYQKSIRAVKKWLNFEQNVPQFMRESFQKHLEVLHKNKALNTRKRKAIRSRLGWLIFCHDLHDKSLAQELPDKTTLYRAKRWAQSPNGSALASPKLSTLDRINKVIGLEEVTPIVDSFLFDFFESKDKAVKLNSLMSVYLHSLESRYTKSKTDNFSFGSTYVESMLPLLDALGCNLESLYNRPKS